MDRRTFMGIVAASLLGTARAAEPQKTGRTYRMGVLAPGGTLPLGFPSLVEGLRALGYVEGQNLIIEPHYAGGIWSDYPISPQSWSECR